MTGANDALGWTEGREVRGHRSIYGTAKRLADFLLAASLILLLAPLALLLAVALATRLGRPVLFRQVRPGLNGRLFRITKFRTMTDARGPDGALLPDADRLTRFGKWLRSTSVDELPSLWNVLCGDMSFVGPRPLLPDYLPLYSAEQARRHDVRPGITGWAQVNGRNALSWEEKFAADVWYVDHAGLVLDLRILWLTISLVLFRRGISGQGSPTMTRFTGSGR